MTDKDLRAATRNDLLLVLKLLNESGVEYMLVGGYALLAHGYMRATTDIDVLVPGNLDSGRKVIRALMALPNQAAKGMEPEWFTEGGTIRVGDEFMVDVMTNANGHTYEELLNHVETIDLDGTPVRTLDLEGLLLTKQTMRAKDAGDRLAIERALAEIRKQSEPEKEQTQAHGQATGIVDRTLGVIQRAIFGGDAQHDQATKETARETGVQKEPPPPSPTAPAREPE
jgi:predicted nucleotidyltransferase